MANNNLYLYLSVLISISLYLFFISLIVFTIFSKTKVEIYALKKDKYMSVSIVMPKTQTSTKEKTINKPVTEESVIEAQDINIDDLFSDVWTKDIKKQSKKKKVNNKKFQDIAKKSKKIDTKSVKVVKKNSRDAKVKSDEEQKTSTGTEVNEYIARITGLVYQVFIPNLQMKNNVVKAVLEISAMGKVTDFRILVYSSNSSLNEECDKMKNRLIGKLFPMHPDKKSSTIIVNLIPENKGNI